MSFELDKTITDYQRSDALIKKLEERKRLAREKLLAYVTTCTRQRTLPQKVVVVAHDYWNKTGISEKSFFATRHPGWQVKEKKSNFEAHQSVYILERDSDFVPSTESIAGIDLIKQVQEFTPEIDWVSLQKDRPDLFDKISRPKIVYELDEERFQKTANEYPELLDVMTRHLKLRRPVIKLLVRKEKADDET